MDEILESHVIQPAALRNDDLQSFFEARRLELLARIEKAMSKPVASDLASVKDA